MLPVTAPQPVARKRACLERLRIFCLSPLPTALEIMARMAVPMAPAMLPTSQLTVVVMLTEAVACSPNCPTMAVSTY